jgi:hypothetical protein
MHKGYEPEPPTDRITTVRIERGIETGNSGTRPLSEVTESGHASGRGN